MNEHFRNNARHLLIPLFAVGMRLACSLSADLSYLVLAAYALLGRKQAIHALFLSWFFTMLSEGVAPVLSHGPVGRYAVIMSATVSVFLRSGMFTRTMVVSRAVIGTLLLGVFLVFHSLLVSPHIDVSILKALTFIIVQSTLLSAWGSLRQDERRNSEKFLFGALIVVLLVSLPLVATSTGFLRNGTGYQGILSHPQSFGPTIALIGAWTCGRLFSERQVSWKYFLILGLCLISIVLSESRTAAGALVLGVAMSVLIIIVSKPWSLFLNLPGFKSKRIQIVGIIIVAGLLLAGPKVNTQFEHFVTKSGRSLTNGVLASAEASRGALLYTMIDNIVENPLFGIGFGVASSPFSMEVKRDPVLGLPLSATIEKGIMPVAVMEELGIIGFMLVVFWFWALARRAARGGFIPLVVLLTVLFINLGESMLFSPGGMGMLLLIFVGWAFTAQTSESGSLKS